MNVLCTIEDGYLVSISTGERVGRARWWHHVLLVWSDGVSCWLDLDELRRLAPRAARELIQAPGAGV